MYHAKIKSRFNDAANQSNAKLERDLRTIFVGGINPLNVPKFEEFLRAKCGEVIEARKVMKGTRATTKCFVEFANKESAQKALALNGTKFGDDELLITLANDKSRQNIRQAATIFVGNLPRYQTTIDDVERLFSPFGAIRDIRLPIDEISKKVKGFAIVEFENEASVEAAIQLRTELHGRRIIVERAGQRQNNKNNNNANKGGNKKHNYNNEKKRKRDSNSEDDGTNKVENDNNNNNNDNENSKKSESNNCDGEEEAATPKKKENEANNNNNSSSSNSGSNDKKKKKNKKKKQHNPKDNDNKDE